MNFFFCFACLTEVIPHSVQSVLLVQELGDVLDCGTQHALVLQVLDTSLRLLVEAVER